MKSYSAAALLLSSGRRLPLANPGNAPVPAGAAQFTEVTRAAGITNTHHKPVLDHQLDNINAWASREGADFSSSSSFTVAENA